jgi:hypothetical protein
VNEASHCRWRPTHLLVLAIVASFVSLPVLAGEGNQPTQVTPNLRAAADRAVSRELRKLTTDRSGTAGRAPAEMPAVSFTDPAGPLRRNERGTTTENRSGRFFKTGPGIAVPAVFAAGAGYALYSAPHDRVHSPGKQ